MELVETMERAVWISCLKNKCTCNIIMIFISSHQRVDSSQMLGETGSFYYNRNFHKGSWYGKPKLVSASHLIWFIDSQISRKGFFIIFKNINGRRKNFLFLYPNSEKTSGPMSKKVDIVLWHIWLDAWTFWLLVTFCSMPKGF